MQDQYLELKIEEVRVKNPFWKFIRIDSLNGREFKDDYHTLNWRKHNDFDKELDHQQPYKLFLEF